MAENPKAASASTVRTELTRLRKEWGWSPSGLVALLKGGSPSSKGSAYERELCKRFSLWWTDGARDDVFWRSSGSGARAKVRGRAGAQTVGQHGDIAATDPIGAPLIDAVTIEIKRGYNEHTFHDLLDVSGGAAVQVYDDFFAQTVESHEQAGSFAWLLIHRRTRRDALVWFPYFLFRELSMIANKTSMPVPFCRGLIDVRGGEGDSPCKIDVGCMKLGTWLDEFTPAHVTAVAGL